MVKNTQKTGTRQIPSLDHYIKRVSKFADPQEKDNKTFFEALKFAYRLHKNQWRKSGEPYISHPIAVVEILALEFYIRVPCILTAALLHDVVEDIPSVTIKDIKKNFGSVVANLVDGCTKLSLQRHDKTTLKEMTHSKIFLSARRNLGVLIIKLADRLHNLRTLQFMPQKKRHRIARETIEIYAPIASKLNLFPLKRELNHLALTHMFPKKSKKLDLMTRVLLYSKDVLEIKEKLKSAFKHISFPVKIRPRLKGDGAYYDHFKRTFDINNAENQVDFTIILDTKNALDCYSVLGIVNSHFLPVPKSIRDFFANPKNNSYRSIHVRSHFKGKNYLFKIRTTEMDNWANYGILNQWGADHPFNENHWKEINELLQSLGEYKGGAPKRKAMLRFSESTEIFVYTPKRDIIYLPNGSVVLDLAYKIHSDLGNFCQGALVNNKWVPVIHQLKDKDTVKILTSQEPLDIDPELEYVCKSPKARTAISKKIQSRCQEYAKEIGQQLITQDIKRYNLSPDIFQSEDISLVIDILNIKNISQMFTQIGQDMLLPKTVLYYFDNNQIILKDEAKKNKDSVVLYDKNHNIFISKLDKCVHKFARCCHPFPGQDNIVTTLSERGLTFHQKQCAKLYEGTKSTPLQIIDIKWDMDKEWDIPLKFDIHIFKDSINSIMPILNKLTKTITINKIEYSSLPRSNNPTVNILVTFHSFMETKNFFQVFEKEDLIINKYFRNHPLYK